MTADSGRETVTLKLDKPTFNWAIAHDGLHGLAAALRQPMDVRDVVGGGSDAGMATYVLILTALQIRNAKKLLEDHLDGFSPIDEPREARAFWDALVRDTSLPHGSGFDQVDDEDK